MTPTRFFLPVFSLVVLCSSCNSPAKPRSGKAEHIGSIDDVRSGDFVVKRGRGHLSNMIVRALDEEIPLSHCGIVSRTQDSVFIIHSVARELTGIDGVQKINYNEFIKDCIPGYFYIVRYKGETDFNDQFHASAKQYLNHHIPFDYEINYKDKKRVNCSELLFQVIRDVTDKDVFTRLNVREQSVIGFNSLLDTNNFRVIYSY